MRLPTSIGRSVSRQMLVAVGAPSAVLATAGVAWLRSETRHLAPGLWGAVAAGAILVALGLSAIHVLAVRALVTAPLRALAAAMRRAREGEWLARVPVRGEDEIAQLSAGFNETLRAITNLHALRTDDALELSSLQRELALKAEIEAQHRLVEAAHRQLEIRVRELTVLAELSQALNATIELDAVCRAVVEAIGRRLGFTAFALFLADPEQGDLVVKSAFGVHERAEGSRLELGAGAAGMAAQERRVVLVPDVGTDPRTSVRSWLPPGAGSLLATPLVHQSECVGVLDFWREQPNAFPEEELRFLQSVAGQAAMAIANARLHQRTVALSLTDSLTGALNRRGLAERLRIELGSAQRFSHAFALAIVDVDRLKVILSDQGLATGDALLRELAGVLGGELRNVDVLARYRGDKFAVVLPRAERTGALAAAEKLRRAVQDARFACLPSSSRVTVSVGVASFPEDARELDGLADAAEAALFAAKRDGRNLVRACAPGMREDPARPQASRIGAVVEPAVP